MKGAPPVPSATPFLSCITTLDLAEWVLRVVGTGSEREAKGPSSLHVF